MNRPQNVTMIDDLPDVNDFDNIIPSNAPNISKFMRQQHRPPVQSGMVQREHNYNGYSNAYQQNHHIYDPEAAQMMNEQYSHHPKMVNEQYSHPGNKASEYSDDINCRDVCSHIKNCEVCKQLYKCDKSLYILTIVILAIVVILLLKKVLDV